jgi:hypothetical protein
VELEEIALFLASAGETKAGKMTQAGVKLECACSMKKKNLLRMFLLKLSPWAKFLGS